MEDNHASTDEPFEIQSHKYSSYGNKLDDCVRRVKSAFLEGETPEEKAPDKFEVDYEKCHKKAKQDVKTILERIKKSQQGSNVAKEHPDVGSMIEELKGTSGKTKTLAKEFENSLNEFKTDQWQIKADRRAVEKRLDAIEGKKKEEKENIDRCLEKKDNRAKKNRLNSALYPAAGVVLVAIAILVAVSIVCPFYDQCPKDLGSQASDTLNSDFMAVLISGVIAPVAVRLVKDRFDVEIESKQVSSILADGFKSVSMWTKYANRLRDENGKISKKDQQRLRNHAFASIKQNYTQSKYKALVSNVGAQVFERAIESAVLDGKEKRIPWQQQQIEKIIGQAIDAYPKIVAWKDLDEDVKVSFIDGHIRKLLQNTGIEGWAYKSLESVFDSEITKRLAAAAIKESKQALNQLGKDTDPYLKYTSTVLESVLKEKP